MKIITWAVFHMSDLEHPLQVISFKFVFLFDLKILVSRMSSSVVLKFVLYVQYFGETFLMMLLMLQRKNWMQSKANSAVIKQKGGKQYICWSIYLLLLSFPGCWRDMPLTSYFALWKVSSFSSIMMNPWTIQCTCLVSIPLYRYFQRVHGSVELFWIFEKSRI